MSARWIRDGDVWWIAVVGGRRAALRDLADELDLYDRAAAAAVRRIDAPENSR